MSALARLPVAEWCHRTAAGQHEDLGWVDATLEIHREVYGTVVGEDGVVRFQHLPYVGFSPPSMGEAAAAAQARGVPTLQEALILLFARVEWLVASADRLLAPTTPVPGLLQLLVDAYGIDPRVHGADPEALARLTAILPTWFPQRGSLAAARRVLEVAGDPAREGELLPLERDLKLNSNHEGTKGTKRDVNERALSLASSAVSPLPEPNAPEVFVCHDLGWWEARAERPMAPLQVRAGVSVIPASDPVPLRKEDLAWRWVAPAAPPDLLLRMLPPWTVLRPFLPAESA